MATDGWQVREWEAAGRIMLGLPYLDAESLALVIGALLTLCNGRVRRLPKMATAPLQTEGHAEEGAVVGAASGRSAGSSYDAVEMARALVRRERGLLEGAFKRAVLQLKCDGSKDDDDDDDNDDDNDDNDNDDGGGEEGVEEDEEDEEDEGDGDEDGAEGLTLKGKVE